MKPRSALALALLLATALFAPGQEGNVFTHGHATTPVVEGGKPKQALAEENVKDLLLLMDTDRNGKISKQEWMKFMEAEFDRLDKDRSGELGPKELQESRISASPSHFEGAGK